MVAMRPSEPQVIDKYRPEPARSWILEGFIPVRPFVMLSRLP